MDNVYISEFLILSDLIKDRELDNFRTQLAIVQNPYSEDPNALWETLNENKDYYEQKELDQAGMENLKSLLSKGSGIVVK